jgi:hypothetical protein
MPAGDRRQGWAGTAGLALLFVLASGRAVAFEFFDGRVDVHGFYKTEIRSIARDYDRTDGWDVTQWAHILNVEVEVDIAPDGVGPFDWLSAFGRVEVRYDCVWTHACGAFPSADAYGNRSKRGRLPKRLRDGHRSGFEYQVFNGDTADYHSRNRETGQNLYDSGGLLGIGNRSPRATPVMLDSVPETATLFNVSGADGILGTPDDPAPFYFSSLFPDCRFGIREVGGTVNGVGTQTLVHTVNKSDCRIRPNGSLRNKPNPFNVNDRDTSMDPRAVLPDGGAFPLPYRPAPLYATFDPGDPSHYIAAPENRAVGVYYPNAHLARKIGDLDRIDQNFRQTELAWNHGASQDEKELKELAVEFEMFDSRLWVRAGKQNIVWGKTELFRTTDQFNPQDQALGSLTTLEESRIALWSVRGAWSFYDVGPIEDVRLELAVNYDDVEPTDLGRCGEPYSPLPACDITFGMMVHGLTGNTIAGYDRPEDPWDSISGIEVGARLEWRVGRFGMALTDFYGYDDNFWSDQNFAYSRNVDPRTGRPRHTMARGRCMQVDFDPDGDGDFSDALGDPDCLLPTQVGSTFDPNSPLQANNSLEFHSVNQQTYALVCATSIGFSDLDLSACAQSVFNSQNTTGGATIATALSNLLAGDPLGLVFGGLLGRPTPLPACDAGAVASGTLCNPLIPLANDVVQDVSLLPPGVDPDLDGAPLAFAEAEAAGLTPTARDRLLYLVGLQGMLTDAEQALLGCGPYYGTLCDGNGIDLLNAEGSALVHSLLGFEGTAPVVALDDPGPDGIFNTDDDVTPLTTNRFLTQPGTLGFGGGPVCTRFEHGQAFILPGCRGLLDVGPDEVPDTLDEILGGTGDDTFESGYEAGVDGTTTSAGPLRIFPAQPRVQPFTGQLFKSEMSVLSWNAVMALVAISSPPDTVLDSSCTPTLGDDCMIPTDENGDGWADSEFIAQDEFDITRPFRSDGCSYAAPGLCGNVRSIGSLMGVQRNTVRAGGNGQFGRRDFLWHGGSEVILRFDKRNVLGFSMDFAEELTGTNWGVEFTWIPNVPTTNNDEFDGISDTDQFNLTLAVDRPTFVNFLNQNRTFFITTQWFMRYTGDYAKGMPGPGPWSVLGTLNVSTGYFQDRLLPAVTFVYDFRSNSGAVLPSVGYRFTENFSATFGLAIFGGRTERRTAALTPISLGNRVGRGAYSSHVDRGLSVIRERDEIFLRVKYAF